MSTITNRVLRAKGSHPSGEPHVGSQHHSGDRLSPLAPPPKKKGPAAPRAHRAPRGAHLKLEDRAQLAAALRARLVAHARADAQGAQRRAVGGAEHAPRGGEDGARRPREEEAVPTCKQPSREPGRAAFLEACFASPQEGAAFLEACFASPQEGAAS